MINLDEVKNDFCFLFNDIKNDKKIYFCNCGTTTEYDLSCEEKNLAIKNDIEAHEENDEFDDLFKSILNSQDDNSNKCKKCNKNFYSLENQKKLVFDNNIFACYYYFQENNDDIFLYCYKIKPNVLILEKKYILDFNKNIKYVRFNKLSKKLFFKNDTDPEFEFDLDKINLIANEILIEERINIYNLYSIQIYINILSKYVIDINNTNVVEELLNEAKNKFNDTGFQSIKKIISIFWAIIKYSNLSTIALTKGCKFLYDLLCECDVPNSQYMKDWNLTSPIPIFNYLVGNYIKKINEEVNEDNKDVHEFIFKSSQMVKYNDEKGKYDVIPAEEKQMKIVYKDNKNYKTGKISHDKNSNKFHVIEFSNDINASKFIYKNITKFYDYKQLLKYFKFYNKQQIITLLQKYNLSLLINIIDLIYFRDNIDIKELERIIVIINDFALNETLKKNPRLNIENVNIDYNNVNNFDFVYYDDSVMMMEVLKFDPKKEFNKIKTYSALVEYHNNLVKYFNVVSDKEKNEKFKNFVDRFKYLENRDDYNGPIELKIISSPSMLINEGVQMKHSASSYSKKVLTESYLICQIFDNSDNLTENDLKRFTIGFVFDSLNGLEFDQVKGFANKQGSDRFKKLLMEFLTAKDISFRPIKDLKLLELS